MKLYVRGDLERCARLASTATRAGTDPELAVQEAVETITADGPLYYDAPTVKALVAYLCTRAPDGPDGTADIERVLHEAMGVIRS